MIKDVANPDVIKQLFRSDLEHINPALKDSPERSLWDLKESIDYPKPSIPGLHGQWGLCQGDAAWSVRTSPVIQQTFAHLFGTTKEQLTVSMGSAGFSSDHDECDNKTWLHVDQAPDLPGSDLYSL